MTADLAGGAVWHPPMAKPQDTTMASARWPTKKQCRRKELAIRESAKV